MLQWNIQFFYDYSHNTNVMKFRILYGFHPYYSHSIVEGGFEEMS